jgi:PAS domain S-box-containing protein
MGELSDITDATAIAAASMDGVGVVVGSEVADANDALAALHGYDSPRELVGREWKRLYSPEDRETAAEQLLARVREERERRGRAFGHQADRGRVPVELSMRATDGGVVCVVRDVTDREERERRLERYETVLDTVRDGVYVLDEQFRFTFVSRGLCELTELSREQLLGRPVIDLFEYDDEIAAAREIRRRVLEGDTSIGTIQGTLSTSAGRRTLEARFRLHPEPDGEYRGSIGVVRDVTDREERERRLERQRDELDTLNRINELLLAVVRELFEYPAEGAIERTVCSRLADSELYEFTWIGKPEAGGDRLVPDASAGLDGDRIQPATVTADEGTAERGLVGRAFRTGTVRVSRTDGAGSAPESWPGTTPDRQPRAAAAVPLNYDGTTYGVLAVDTSRPLAFSRRERRGFEILGEAIGYAINATRTRRLLHAESVSELEFDLVEAGTVLAETSATLGCSVSCDGYVATGDGDWLLYLTVAGDGAERFVDVVARDDRVRSVTSIKSDGDGRSVGLTTESSLLDTVAAVGGNLIAATIDAGTGRITVEVPGSTDVRAFVDQVRAIYPGATLASRTTHERPVTRDSWLGETRGPALTERQRQALEAAFRAGYFEWPRASSAEEVAELLGIAGPTLHGHLRKAERELLSVFFDATGPGGDRRAEAADRD